MYCAADRRSLIGRAAIPYSTISYNLQSRGQIVTKWRVQRGSVIPSIYLMFGSVAV